MTFKYFLLIDSHAIIHESYSTVLVCHLNGDHFLIDTARESDFGG